MKTIRMSPQEIAPWLFRKDTFAGADILFTRDMPKPWTSSHFEYRYFDDGTSECFVSHIKLNDYFVIELRSEAGTYLDTFYAAPASYHTQQQIEHAAWNAFGYRIDSRVTKVSSPWRHGSNLKGM